MKKLDPAKLDRTLRVAMDGAVRIMAHEVKKYPSPPSRADKERAKKAWSDKQRRWFFWALKKGRIDVPYRRGQSPGSEKLGSSWSTKVTKRGKEIWGVIQTRVSYARFVVDKDSQATIHRRRWTTVQQVVKDTTGDVQKLFDRALRKALGT